MEVMTGDSLTCEQVTEKITRLMNRAHTVGGNLFYFFLLS